MKKIVFLGPVKRTRLQKRQQDLIRRKEQLTKTTTLSDEEDNEDADRSDSPISFVNISISPGNFNTDSELGNRNFGKAGYVLLTKAVCIIGFTHVPYSPHVLALVHVDQLVLLSNIRIWDFQLFKFKLFCYFWFPNPKKFCFWQHIW